VELSAPPKNKSQKQRKIFDAQKYVHQHTTIHHASTTISPPKNHDLRAVFRKTPTKNANPPRRKINPPKIHHHPSTIAE